VDDSEQFAMLAVGLIWAAALLAIAIKINPARAGTRREREERAYRLIYLAALLTGWAGFTALTIYFNR
jgi:hypothetical protein